MNPYWRTRRAESCGAVNSGTRGAAAASEGRRRNLLFCRRGTMYDASGAQLALHLWLGPFGLHVFRRPFAAAPDFDRAWRSC